VSPAEHATELVLAVARGLLFVREEPKSSNAGQAVEAFQKATGNRKGEPWCASFVGYCGLVGLGPRWPLPQTGSCVSLGTAAATQGALGDDPRVGDVFLLHFPKLGRFAHTGFISGPQNPDGSWPTIEGNSNDGGSREGWGVFARSRKFGPKDKTIRWVRLLN
jgi:hypothetical protein